MPEFKFVYTGIRVRDLDRALQFYVGILGMKLRKREKELENRGEFAIVESEGSDQTLEINWYEDDSPVAGPYREGEELDHLAFRVDAFDDALDHLARAGHPVVMGPIDDGKYRVAYVKDPDGIWVEVYEVREAAGR